MATMAIELQKSVLLLSSSPSSSSLHQHQQHQQHLVVKKRKCRRVGFGPDQTLAHIERTYEISQEERDERWYRPPEIASFKQDARNLCRERIGHAKNLHLNHTGSTTTRHGSRRSSSTEDEQHEEESIRGLDVYYPHRQRYCKKFIKHVLEAYHVRCVGNDRHVALLAEKWSKKSLDRAYATGKKDFFTVYFPEEDTILYDSLLQQKKELAAAAVVVARQAQPQTTGPVTVFATSA